jgi:hypothetical protein
MPAGEFVPLGPLVEELTRFPGGKFFGVFFDLEGAVKEALGSGDVPMRGWPAREVYWTKADVSIAPRSTRKGLPKRIPLALGTRIEFGWPHGWTVTVPRLASPWTLSIGGPAHETFEDIAVDRIAFEDALAALAQAQCLVLPEWPAELFGTTDGSVGEQGNEGNDDESSADVRGPGQPRHKMHPVCRQEWLRRAREGEEPSAGELRRWLIKARPDESQPKRKTVERWVRGWRAELPPNSEPPAQE